MGARVYVALSHRAFRGRWVMPLRWRVAFAVMDALRVGAW